MRHPQAWSSLPLGWRESFPHPSGWQPNGPSCLPAPPAVRRNSTQADPSDPSSGTNLGPQLPKRSQVLDSKETFGVNEPTATHTCLDRCGTGVESVLHDGLKMLDQVSGSNRPAKLGDATHSKHNQVGTVGYRRQRPRAPHLPTGDAEGFPGTADSDRSVPHSREGG